MTAKTASKNASKKRARDEEDKSLKEEEVESTTRKDPIKAPPGSDLVGKRIEVFWDEDEAWYVGKVKSFSRARGHFVVYDPVPGENDLSEYHDLSEETWRLEGQSTAIVPASTAIVPAGVEDAAPEPAADAVLLLPVPGPDLLKALQGFEERIEGMMEKAKLEELSKRLNSVGSAVTRRLAQLKRRPASPGINDPD